MLDFSQEAIGALGRAARTDLVRAQDRARLLVRALRFAPQDHVRAQAAEALVDLGAPAVRPLIEYLEDDQVQRGTHAQDVLVRIGAAAVEPLIELLGHGEARVRAAVAWMFTSLIDHRACPALVAALDDDDEAVRQCAAYALGDQHCYWAVPRLIELLDDRALRRRAGDVDRPREELEWQQLRLDTDAAGQLWDDGVAELIEEELASLVGAAIQSGDPDDEDYVGAAAAYALGVIADPRALEPLMAVAGDGDRDWLIRGQAVWALGELGDARAFDLVLEALADPDCEPEALAALGGFHDPRAIQVFSTYYRHSCPYIRQQTVIGLREHGGPEAVRYLVAMLHDRHRVVRGFAARALGDLGDERAIEPLLYCLRYGDGDFRRDVLAALDDLAG